jgi:hypothetical protein
MGGDPKPERNEAMRTRTAAPVLIVAASLLVLTSGSAGIAAPGGQVRDDLRPAQAAALALARGHVVERADLAVSPVVADRIERAIEQARQADAGRAFSADARRELHSQPVAAAGTVTAPFSAAAMRELKGSGSAQVHDDLSPLHDGRPTPTPPADTVDDDQSPLGGSE